ncbi:MAG TPA: helix-turn-helix transcriptional regulator [Oscillospiraceae bacterium]|nr:helix-turn-helix transcriptional regulator [Oscillospiraceae bacterium]
MQEQYFPLSVKEAEKAHTPYSSDKNKASGFPTKLRKLREEKGTSQQALASAIGVAKSSIGLYENGDNVPDVKTIVKLANFYDVSADYLLGMSGVATVNTNARAACDYTGLNVKTVDYLHAHLADTATFLKDFGECVTVSEPIIQTFVNELVGSDEINTFVSDFSKLLDFQYKWCSNHYSYEPVFSGPELLSMIKTIRKLSKGTLSIVDNTLEQENDAYDRVTSILENIVKDLTNYVEVSSKMEDGRRDGVPMGFREKKGEIGEYSEN